MSVTCCKWKGQSKASRLRRGGVNKLADGRVSNKYVKVKYRLLQRLHLIFLSSETNESDVLLHHRVIVLWIITARQKIFSTRQRIC